ncbi:MAG: alpha/beta hydrolase family esterase [Bradymonadia bacterium]
MGQQAFWWSFLVVFALSACSDEGGTSDDTAGALDTDRGVMMDIDADLVPDTSPQPDQGPIPDAAIDGERVPRIESGLYSMGVALAELGGFEVPFQVEVVVTETDGQIIFEKFVVRATDGENISDPIADAGPVVISPLGTFVAESGDTVMPAAFSPTGSDVRLNLVFEGRIVSPSFVCGRIRGALITIDTELVDSAFALEPWEGRSPMPPAYCEAQAIDPCPRLDAAECPALSDGLMEGFVSCGAERTFEVHLPAGHDPEGSWPVLYLYHGLGGSHEGMAMYSGMLELIDELGFILVVPSSTKLPVEWEQFTVRDNLDLAWFDDSLLCLQTQLGVDPNRVYVSGMSAGGLYASYLGLMRADIIAATAPMSGGLIINYPTTTARKLPFMASWGGENDFAVEQNFHTFSQSLIADLKRREHTVIACDHGGGHRWDQNLNRAIWRFLTDHPLDLSQTTYTEELPDVFPPYCELVP